MPVVEFQECSAHARQDATIMRLYIETAMQDVQNCMQTRLNLIAVAKHTLAYHEIRFSSVSELEAKGKMSAVFAITLRSICVTMKETRLVGEEIKGRQAVSYTN